MKVGEVNIIPCLWLLGVLCFVIPAKISLAYNDIQDGQVHNISGVVSDTIRLDYSAQGMGTTVNWLNGATFDSSHTNWCMKTYNDSIANFKGGTTLGGVVVAYGRSHVNISAGTQDSVQSDEFSYLSVTGGSPYFIYASKNGHVQFGGSATTSGMGIFDSAQVQISGGIIGGMNVYNTSQVTITGGTVNDTIANVCNKSTGQISIYGGNIRGELTGYFSGVFSIYGSNFAVDGQPVGYGQLTSILGGNFTNDPIRHLTGTLATGDSFDTTFQLGQTSKIVLVPEPATLLLLGAGGMMLRRHRR